MDRQAYFKMTKKLIPIMTSLGRDSDAIFFILRCARMLLHLRDQISQTTRDSSESKKRLNVEPKFTVSERLQERLGWKDKGAAFVRKLHDIVLTGKL